MQLSSEMKADILVVTPNADRIDAACAIHLKDQFRDLTSNHDGRVAMDISQVTFMDSSGLGAMVAALKLLGGRKLELIELTPTVEKVFRLTRMDQVFIIHKDRHAVFGRDDVPVQDTNAA